MRRRDAVALRQITRAREHEVFGDDAVAHDAALPVHVGEKRVQGVDALCEPAFEQRPFVMRDDARDRVEGEQPLVELVVLVEAEPHAVARELLVDARGTGHQIVHTRPLSPAPMRAGADDAHAANRPRPDPVRLRAPPRKEHLLLYMSDIVCMYTNCKRVVSCCAQPRVKVRRRSAQRLRLVRSSRKAAAISPRTKAHAL